MQDKLRIVKSGVVQRRRLGGDIPLRNDLLSNRQHEFITTMIKHVNPASPFLIFTGLLGDSFDPLVERERDKLFDFTTTSIGSEFIRVQEEVEEYKALTILDNSRVPEEIRAGVPFELSIELGVLDEGEAVQLHDQDTILRVISRRNTNGKRLDVTFELVGHTGDTMPAYLLAPGMPINVGYGNSKGEGSENSNTLELQGTKKNLFVNPMMITRYMFKQTGSYMSDEVFQFQLEEAMDGSKPMNFYTDIPVEFFRKAVKRLENQIMEMKSNFDPETLTINSSATADNMSYPDRPSYAGVWEQLDQSPLQQPWPLRSKYGTSFAKFEAIQQEMQRIWTGCDIMIVCQGVGRKFVLDAIREGGMAKYPTRVTQVIGDDAKILIGYGIRKVVNDYGSMLIYDIETGYQTKGEFENVTYNGVTSSKRSRDIFFIPIKKGAEGYSKKTVKYYTKSGKNQNSGAMQVNRGMVFGRMNGLTGEGNGMTGAEMMSIQEQAFSQMLSNRSDYNLNSRVDGNEYHVLFEGVPYIDIYGTYKLTLVD